MSNCPCGSGSTYAACCGPLVGGAPAPTAEALMRSRYSAYVKHDIAYLERTLSANQRQDFVPADAKKWENRRTYQEIIFGMLGKKFNGEEYILPVEPQSSPAGQEKAGLETRSGDRWVGKRWNRFPELMELLKAEKIKTVKFKAFPTLAGFIKHINGTDLVVTTDSLALHVALALKKKVVALFTCTSWHEIHGYGRMEKIVSPVIEKYFYNTTEEALKSGEAIEPGKVLEALKKLREEKAAV